MSVTTTTLKTRTKENIMVKRLVVTALMASMITVMTAYICHVPTGVNEGYIHFGDVLIYIAAAILPAPYAMSAAAIGGGLADLLTAPAWAPATILIKMLLTVPFTSKNVKIVNKRNVIALICGIFITVGGYFIAEGIMYGFTAALSISAIGNVIQSVGSASVFLLFGTALDKAHFKARFMRD